MNTKAMEAAQEITDTHVVLSQATDDIEAVTKEVAAIISKRFPEPSVPVSELKEMYARYHNAGFRVMSELMNKVAEELDVMIARAEHKKP